MITSYLNHTIVHDSIINPSAKDTTQFQDMIPDAFTHDFSTID